MDSNSNQNPSESLQVASAVDELVPYSTTEYRPSLLQASQKEVKETGNRVGSMHTFPSGESGNVQLTGAFPNEATIANILSALKTAPNCEDGVTQHRQRGSETMVEQRLTAIPDANCDAPLRSTDVYGDARANGTAVINQSSPTENQLSTRKRRARTGCLTCKERNVKVKV